MKVEYAVAKTGSMPIIYTKIGTERIDPPLPINPSVIPTHTDNTYPII